MHEVGDGTNGLALVTTHLRTGVLEALAVGELDLLTGPQLAATVLAQAGCRPTDVDIVLSGVDFIDSTGVLALLHLQAEVTARGGRLRLVAPSEPVLFVLDLSGLRACFEIG